ncbi:hypothetical protein [Paraburkholderia caribensis]|uniref:hypothetical protein n=1 Tax=Paraburkholderia caribensis TaxID=75105 RepID=UPI001476127B|nr:hypothetical protein [Paraburkholderia caribensis]
MALRERRLAPKRPEEKRARKSGEKNQKGRDGVLASLSAKEPLPGGEAGMLLPNRIFRPAFADFIGECARPAALHFFYARAISRSMVHRQVPPDSGGTARAVLACRRALASQ